MALLCFGLIKDLLQKGSLVKMRENRKTTVGILGFKT
jgi:hypothetical protein